MAATEQEVDFAAIRPGDKVKLRYHGLESTDWHEVIKLDVTGGLHVGTVDGVDWYVAEGGEVRVIAHQPAPRTVEVTLGKPLTSGSPRDYSAALSAERFFVHEDDGLDVYVSILGHRARIFPDEARRLALDLLATVGVDD